MPPLVLVTNKVDKSQFPLLDSFPGGVRWIFADSDLDLMPRSRVLTAARDADAIINQGELRVDPELLQAAPRLRIIANVAIGTDNFDLDAMTARGVWATNAPNAFTESTADATLALLLAVTRRVAEGDRYLRQGVWERHGMRPSLWEGPLLQGRTLGLLGFGQIGQAVARRARAFGMEVIHHTRTPRSAAEGWRSLEDLLRESDIVSLHVPLTSSTRHLIDADMIERMKPSAYLVNLARGAVVDEAALAAALDRGRLAGAGLDVFEAEPRIHPALLTSPRVVLTPHLGGAASEARQAARALAAENVARVLQGHPPETPVNRIDFPAAKNDSSPPDPAAP